MELLDLYHHRMRMITEALDDHSERETKTALSALGRIRTIVGMGDTEVEEEYAAYRRESEPDWQAPK